MKVYLLMLNSMNLIIPEKFFKAISRLDISDKDSLLSNLILNLDWEKYIPDTPVGDLIQLILAEIKKPEIQKFDKELLKEFQAIAKESNHDYFPFFVFCMLDLGWKPKQMHTVQYMKDWSKSILREWGVKSNSDAIQIIRDFYRYWETRKGERKQKNWLATFRNNPCMPNHNRKYENK